MTEVFSSDTVPSRKAQFKLQVPETDPSSDPLGDNTFNIEYVVARYFEIEFNCHLHNVKKHQVGTNKLTQKRRCTLPTCGLLGLRFL